MFAAVGALAALAGPAAAFEYTVYDYDHAVWRVGEDGSGATPLIPATRDYPARDNYKNPALSPDGQRVAYTDGWNIYLVDIDGQAWRAIFTARYWGYVNERNQKPQFGPDGQKLIFEREVSGSTNSRDIYSMSTAVPERVNPVITWPGYQYDPTYSSDGSLIAFTSRTTPSGTALANPQLFVANADGSNPRQLTTSSKSLGEVSRPRFSADDSKIAFSAIVPASGKTALQSEIFTISPAGTGFTNVTRTATGSEGAPEWTSDGRISYSGDGGYSKMNADGTGKTLWLGTSTGAAHMPWGNLSFRKRRRAIDPHSLVSQYVPVLKYDSQQNYYADSAGEMTDNYLLSGYTNELISGGARYATSDPTLGHPQLGLDFLGSQYALTNAFASDSDYINQVDASRLQDYQRMHAQTAYGNKAYGRAVRASDGKWWLQYWFFYYFNEGPQGWLPHEGDWEMVQYRLDSNLAPELAVYAQHNHGERCAINGVEMQWTSDNHYAPVVYVARGSQASYFESGQRPVLVEARDYHYGDGDVVRPTLQPDMRAGEERPWVSWPGRWGEEDGSPKSPIRQTSKWIDPKVFSDDALSCWNLGATASRAKQKRAGRRAWPNTVASPAIRARRVGRSAVVSYRVPARARSAAAEILLTLDGAGGAEYVPVTRTRRIRGSHGRHRLALPIAPGPYVARASIVTRNGKRSRVVMAKVR